MQVFFWIPSGIGVRDKLFSKGGEDYNKNQESCKGRLKDGDCIIRGSRLWGQEKTRREKFLEEMD
jgi:hypothetical protein